MTTDKEIISNLEKKIIVSNDPFPHAIVKLSSNTVPGRPSKSDKMAFNT